MVSRMEYLGQGSATFCIKRAILAHLPQKKNVWSRKLFNSPPPCDTL